MGLNLDGLRTMLLLGFISFVLLIVVGTCNCYHHVNPAPIVLESKTILVPEIKLHTDGKVVDTIYIYKIKVK